MSDLDADLLTLSKEGLIAEAKKLRAGIRQHRDSSGHDLCWFVPELWDLLPEKIRPTPEVPPTEEFLSKCCVYRASLNQEEITREVDMVSLLKDFEEA
jgi:hypothetical protein